MSLALRQRASIRRLVGRYRDGTATFRRPHTLADKAKPSGPVLSTVGAVAKGATTFSIDASGRLEGMAPAGLKIGFALVDPASGGVLTAPDGTILLSQEFTLAADATAAAGVLAVTVTAGLAIAVPDNTRVVLVTAYAEYKAPVSVGGFRDLDRSDSIKTGDRSVLVETSSIPVELTPAWQVTLPGESAPVTIVSARRQRGGSVESGVVLQVRGATRLGPRRQYALNRGSTARLARRFGGSARATIRRPHSLKDRQKGTVALKIDGTVAAGGSTVVLDSAGKLSGFVPAGVRLKIGADATVYETTADATVAATGKLTLSLTPVLAAEATDDAAVTVTRAYAEYKAPAAVGNFRDADRRGGQISSADRVMLLDTSGLPFAVSQDEQIIPPGESAAAEVVDLQVKRDGGLRVQLRGAA